MLTLNKADAKVIVSLLWRDGVPHDVGMKDGKWYHNPKPLFESYRPLARKIHAEYPDLFKSKYHHEVIAGWLEVQE